MKGSAVGVEEGQYYFENSYREWNITGMKNGLSGNQEQWIREQREWYFLDMGANLCHHRVGFKMKFGPLFSTLISECHDTENWIQLN